MFSRIEKYKKKKSLIKIAIILGVLLLSISFGTGVKNTLADSDIESLLANWFNNKKTASINKIDKAITEERDLLQVELKSALQSEIQNASSELAQFTENEKNKRIANLRAYAEELKANIQIDKSDEQAVISANFDAIIESAIAEMNGTAAPVQPVLVPSPIPVKPDSNSGAPPDSTPVTEPEPKPDSTAEPEPTTETEPKPDSTAEPEPTTEPEPKPDSTAEPEPTTESDPKTDSSTEPELKTEPESKPESAKNPEPITAPELALKSESKQEPESDPEPAPKAVSAPKPELESGS